jgi:hypothetical protein
MNKQKKLTFTFDGRKAEVWERIDGVTVPDMVNYPCPICGTKKWGMIAQLLEYGTPMNKFTIFMECDLCDLKVVVQNYVAKVEGLLLE